MCCKDITPLLSEYVDGVLERDRVAILEAHLVKCEICRGGLDALRQTLALLQTLDKVAPPDDLLQRIHSELEGEVASTTERQTQGNRIWLFINRPLVRLAIAASLLGIVSIHMLHNTGSGPKTVDTRSVSDLPAEQVFRETVDEELSNRQASFDKKADVTGPITKTPERLAGEAVTDAGEKSVESAAEISDDVVLEIAPLPSAPAVAVPVVKAESRQLKRGAEAGGSIWGAVSAPAGMRTQEPMPEAAEWQLEADREAIDRVPVGDVDMIVAATNRADVIKLVARFAVWDTVRAEGIGGDARRSRLKVSADTASAPVLDEFDEDARVIQVRVEADRYAEFIAHLQALGKITASERATGDAALTERESNAQKIDTDRSKAADGQVINLIITIIQP